MDIEEAKKFSLILDNLLNGDQLIRETTEKKVQELIKKNLILTFCYSIYKSKGKKKIENKTKYRRTKKQWKTRDNNLFKYLKGNKEK